ncbi:hypothetical protein B0J18DRAFT_387464 [Chaetomium sp. MPI-SDFR-AT-0129]|nr:hypothetical protein B0J18DRAFT_387464 [Chaetomium sp. MPI-SDFR-AT-0129]
MTRLTIAVTLLALAATCSARTHSAGNLFLHARDVDEQYDYIVVGGGTAGLTVADRLTEDGETTVLVVEYGELSSDDSIKTVTGGFAGISDPSHLFTIQSLPQTNLANRTIAVVAGKVVGGSSAVNAMMTIRGTADDYTRWGQFFHDDDDDESSHWSWDGLLPYFKRALTFAPPGEAVTKEAGITFDTAFWGTAGNDTDGTTPVYAGWPSFQYPGTTAQIEAFRGIDGVPFVNDSGAGEAGVYWYPTFMDPTLVERSYARTGHHDRAANRENYHLVTGSRVLRVVFDGTTATGVAVVPVSPEDGDEATETIVGVRKEVIIAAGGIHSPQVLQLSGIGPRELLESAGITTLVDLPGVGQNFQDHPILRPAFTYNNFPIHPNPQDLILDANFSAWTDTLWNTNRTGPKSLATGNAAAWLPFPIISPRALNLSDALTTQNHSLSLPPNTHPTVLAGYRAQMLSLASALASNGTAFYNLILTGGATNGIVVDLHPLSRGTVNINTTDPFHTSPVVDYRALSNPLDVAIMADLIRFTRRYHLSNPLTADWNATEVSPGEATQTDEEFETYFAESISPSEYHPSGTCAMLPRELGGVVDEELKVYGLEGVRVVDASVFPTLVGGNTCQPVYAVAEKAADLIRFGPPEGYERA